MKKEKQKGFMLAEAFIVSTFVLGILVFMFLQIKTIINGYNKSFTYNTVEGIYHTREIKKEIQKEGYFNLLNTVDSQGYAVIDKNSTTMSNLFDIAQIKRIIISKSDFAKLKTYTTSSNKLQNYIMTINTGDSNYMFIVEFDDDTFAAIEGDYNEK